MTALPASPQPHLSSVERALSSRISSSPLSSPRPANGFIPPPSPRFFSGPNGKPEGEGLDQWFEDLSKYEATLEAMAKASQDPKFSEELGTIEQWFKVLNEAERTAALYTLLQHSNQMQIRFLIAVLQQMLGPNPPATAALEGSFKPQTQTSRSLRPPDLNLALTSAPVTPTPLSALKSAFSSTPDHSDGSWANMVNTPLVPMFQKPRTKPESPLPPPMMSPFPGMVNPLALGPMGLANETQLSQLLAMQMMMSGMVQPGIPLPQQQPIASHKSTAASKGSNWRPSSARQPSAAPRSGATKSNSNVKTNTPASTTTSDDKFNPELLQDIPGWLRSLRLHKYTDCFAGMSWQEMVELDDPTLEKKGVAALGARRRLLKTFENVKEKMGLAVPTEGTAEPDTAVS